MWTFDEQFHKYSHYFKAMSSDVWQTIDETSFGIQIRAIYRFMQSTEYEVTNDLQSYLSSYDEQKRKKQFKCNWPLILLRECD